MRSLLLLSLILCSSAFYAQLPAPDFTITTSDGQVRQLYADYINQQKLVVVEAFFTSCPPCSAHATPFQNLYTAMKAEYPGQVEFMLLSTLVTDTNVKVAQYLTNKNMTMLGAGKDGGSITALQPYMGGAYGAFQGTPTFFIIAPGSGQVFFDIRGNSATETMALLEAKIGDLIPKNCTVTDPFGEALEEVEMNIDAAGFDSTFLVSGTYDLSDVASLQNRSYTLKPTRDGHPSGLTTYDLVLISKHILALEPLQCPWQIIAADVNCSGSVTTFDIVNARKVILGIENNFPCGSMRFMPDSAAVSNGKCQSFIGVNLGDVNAGPCTDSLNAPTLERKVSNKLWFRDRYLKAGETLSVPVYLEHPAFAEGLQLSFSFNPAKAEMRQISSDILPEFSSDIWHNQGGLVRLSWFHLPGVDVQPHTALFQVQFTVLQDVWLSELLQWSSGEDFPAEIYSPKGYIHQLRASSWQGIAQIYPNPAKGYFWLSMENEAGEQLIQLTDVQGKKVFKERFVLEKGFNLLEIDCPQIPPGIYMVLANNVPIGKVILK
ncbi:MAG: T9SS type A sorting domain-containing protein [Chitinophagales bacterium]|nr:T9SS type A sorting domain-containing protein [Chitinophagales bacterium]